MLQGMALQQCAMGEGPVAHVALKGALGTVSAHVHVERAFLGEALATHGALKGPDAGVHHHVFEEVVTQGEGAPADGALVRFLTWWSRKQNRTYFNNPVYTHTEPVHMHTSTLIIICFVELSDY